MQWRENKTLNQCIRVFVLAAVRPDVWPPKHITSHIRIVIRVPACSSFPTRFGRIGTHRSLHISINKNRSGDHAGERGGSTLRGVSRGNQPCHARQRGHIRLSQSSRAANTGFSHPNKRKIWAIPKKGDNRVTAEALGLSLGGGVQVQRRVLST